MHNRILITSLISLYWCGALVAQPQKSSLPKMSALAKAFQPNASKAENLETLRRTLGLSPHARLEWSAGIDGVDMFSAFDDFDRSELGSDWAVDDGQWEIRDDELALKPAANFAWQYLAVYTPVFNSLERRIHAVSYRWGRHADKIGIREGAHALMLDGPTPNASGYWNWHRTNWEQVWLWFLNKGSWVGSFELDHAAMKGSNPVAGDVVTVVIRPAETANFFDYYINTLPDATVKDVKKYFPKTNIWYVGVFLHGYRLNNQIDDFRVTWQERDAFPPAAVADLKLAKSSYTNVTLEWTAPGDNSFDGRAKRYDLRYSTNRILTDAAFAAATPAPNPITPGPGGSREQMVIAGLMNGKTYYFAVKTIDEEGNVAKLSNEVSARTPACISLPAAAAYGKIPGGDQTYADKVAYCFLGRSGDFYLSYQAYDISGVNEVDVFLNGVKVQDVPLTGKSKWSGNLGVVLPDALVNNTGLNVIVFDNTNNPPASFWWGVRQVAVEEYRMLPAAAAYGKIPGGDQTHEDKVVYFFAGRAGEVSLLFQVYDLESNSELDLLLNGVKVRDIAMTADNKWSATRKIVLPDSLVNNAGVNVLVFDNMLNPPQSSAWGVRAVSLGAPLSREPAVANTVTAQEAALSTEFSLAQNYPNPFSQIPRFAGNPSTTIRFGLPAAGFVKLAVYNLRGELVRRLVGKEMPAGYHQVIFDASGLAAGAYFYRLEAASPEGTTITLTRKMTVVK